MRRQQSKGVGGSGGLVGFQVHRSPGLDHCPPIMWMGAQPIPPQRHAGQIYMRAKPPCRWDARPGSDQQNKNKKIKVTFRLRKPPISLKDTLPAQRKTSFSSEQTSSPESSSDFEKALAKFTAGKLKSSWRAVAFGPLSSPS